VDREVEVELLAQRLVQPALARAVIEHLGRAHLPDHVGDERGVADRRDAVTGILVQLALQLPVFLADQRGSLSGGSHHCGQVTKGANRLKTSSMT